MIGEYRDALILALAIVPLTGMDIFLHWRTAASTKDLQSRLTATATVIRDGRTKDLPSSELVPGDLVRVRPGEFIPADGLIVVAKEAQVDESSLTGESLPLRKSRLESLPLGAEPSINSEHWGWAGTKLLAGELSVKLVFTGAETYYGEVISSVSSSAHEKTPLQKAIMLLVKRLLIAAALLCLALASTRLMQGKGFIDALISALTLAVAAIPEEFPLVFAFFLGVGVYRMARRKALVRRAVSVENLGRVTCICTDKTGTLTEGQLRLAHMRVAEGFSESDLLRAAVLSSRGESQDPIDQAILSRGAEAESQNTRVAVFPFTEARRREVSICTKDDETLLVAMKGAPETIFARINVSSESLIPYQRYVAKLAGEGHKLIACALAEVRKSEWHGEEPEHGFQLIGLLAFEDPVRDGVQAAIKACQEARIHVLMITGDHPDTAAAIARDIGLAAQPRVYCGDHEGLEQKDGAFFMSMDVIARVLPAQKLAVVSALKASGQLVVVTGDGINDVPALQAADIGVAMGERGTRSAREVASVVLSDDNFSTIVVAVAEGRQLLENLRLSFMYLLTIHIPLVLTAAFLPILGFPLVYLPIHIVWLELVIHPTAILAFQNNPRDELAEINQQPSPTILAKADWWATITSGITTAMVITILYLVGLAKSEEYARTLTIVTLLFANAISAALLSRMQTPAAWAVVTLTALSMVVITEIPAFYSAMHLVPLALEEWLLTGVTAVLAVYLPYHLSLKRPLSNIERRRSASA